MLIPSVIVLRLGILNYNKASKSNNLWDSGLGDASTGTTLAGLSIPGTASGIFSMIFLANVPQILVSLTYFFYNGLLTCMLSAVEYDNYATDQKPLRVSWPRGAQRSTYYLSLPYRYSVPLLVVSAVLHWLVSQSLFLRPGNPIQSARSTSKKLPRCPRYLRLFTRCHNLRNNRWWLAAHRRCTSGLASLQIAHAADWTV
jgi:hypothetical protein